ncbi:LOW QUALITY PROTEIN: hypothetical protein RvY_15383 [Ramazzottius varieornatus]|uniref:Reverse transcriptase domain-containing protein n=1 Tax=Ramazzottius varieornatus TaxID=947166 RepID=A0A1D1VWB8_RAMVA|nr:LOW QUALITY PROTEIN: hypothetical protein RvY_15383 [Ramazzottius varieornatus]
MSFRCCGPFLYGASLTALTKKDGSIRSIAVGGTLRRPASMDAWIYGDQVLPSARGVQQGDPLGPLFFCLVTKELSKPMESELNYWYLDYATIGEDVDRVLEDFQQTSCTQRRKNNEYHYTNMTDPV